MEDAPQWRFYAAAVSSLVSTLAWLAAVAGFGYTLYVVATSGSISVPISATIVAVVAGILFAQIEKHLYRTEESFWG